MKHLFIGIIATLLLSPCFSSCEKLDDNRIPFAQVHIALDNDGLWNTYGVHGAGQYRMFIKQSKIPGNYAYKISDYTGYGGLLLISDLSNNPLLYDLSCPVEAKSNIIVRVNSQFEAVCPSCGSVYNIMNFNGSPVSGPAHEHKYKMKQYNVVKITTGGCILAR